MYKNKECEKEQQILCWCNSWIYVHLLKQAINYISLNKSRMSFFFHINTHPAGRWLSTRMWSVGSSVVMLHHTYWVAVVLMTLYAVCISASGKRIKGKGGHLWSFRRVIQFLYIISAHKLIKWSYLPARKFGKCGLLTFHGLVWWERRIEQILMDSQWPWAKLSF